jgi:mRNA degradation ribonuclease J1/J2
LSDGAGSAGVTTKHVLDGGEKAFDIDTMMMVESFVFSGDERTYQYRAYLLITDGRAVFVVIFTNGDAVLIDGSIAGEADSTVLRERMMLSDDGVVAVALAVSAGSGYIIGMPGVSAMGFLYDTEHEKIEAACRRHITEYAEKMNRMGHRLVHEIDSGRMQSELRSFLYSRTKRRPVIMINVVEV